MGPESRGPALVGTFLGSCAAQEALSSHSYSGRASSTDRAAHVACGRAQRGASQSVTPTWVPPAGSSCFLGDPGERNAEAFPGGAPWLSALHPGRLSQGPADRGNRGCHLGQAQAPRMLASTGPSCHGQGPGFPPGTQFPGRFLSSAVTRGPCVVNILSGLKGYQRALNPATTAHPVLCWCRCWVTRSYAALFSVGSPLCLRAPGEAYAVSRI